MAVTVATTALTPLGMSNVLKPKPPGDIDWMIANLSLTGTYATGGFPLLAAVAALFSVSRIEMVVNIQVQPNANTVADAIYNYATGNIQLESSTGAELANATAVTTTVVTVLFTGT